MGVVDLDHERPVHRFVELTQLDVRVTWDEAVSVVEELCVAAQGLVMRPIPAAEFSNLVGAIYDCALDPQRWGDAIGRIGELCESGAGGNQHPAVFEGLES